MAVEAIRTIITCDRCGIEFSVAIDAAHIPPPGWSMHDIAVDAVRGSLEYEQLLQFGCPQGHGGVSSVQNHLMLCCGCTNSIDEENA